MSLRFIVGRAGTGKTRYCLSAIHKELLARPRGPGIILLVPEQATFQMERTLASLPGLAGSMRAHVLSFRRLAWRVLQEAGGAARPHLRETGKRMVLRKLLEEKMTQLKVFHRAARQPNFADSLAHALAELKTYCVTPQQLTALAAALGPEYALLRGKLEDMSLIYASFDQFLAGRFIAPDDYLDLLASRLPGSSLCRDAEVWVDGFSSFTPQEFRVLRGLLTVSTRVNVVLCCDSTVLGKPLDEQELFHCTHQTHDTLLDLARQAGVEVEEMLVLERSGPHRFAANPVLSHIEEYLFCWPRRAWAQNTDGLRLVAAHNRHAEVEGAAREIIALSRDRGYRWREISVLVRDISLYADLVTRVFDDHGIPCFIDHKRPVLHHPLIELLRSALETVASGWAYDPVFRYLKTDLVPVAREEVDELENYVLAHGIRGNRWTDGRPWEYRRRYSLGEDEDVLPEQAEELDRINGIRAKVVPALAAFDRSVRENTTARGISEAIYHLLTGLGVKEQLEKWSGEARESGQLDKAREHAQIYNQVLLLLDEMVEALGEQPLTLEEYGRVLEAGLENLRLGLIPPGLDQVFVGSLDRSRNPDVRANFLLGVNDGVLPARPSGEGLLTDSERELLQAGGLQLAPGGKRSLFDEQYLAYQGFTRASEYLWISYALADQEGNGLNPSTLVEDLKTLFPHLPATICPLEPEGGDKDLEFIAHPSRALSYLTGRLREAKTGSSFSPLWGGAYNWLVRNAPALTRQVVAGIFRENRENRLQPATRRNLYGTSLRAGITQLEQFIACPFGHFVRYGLRARERPTSRVRPVDLGRFFHAALKMFVERLEQEGLAWEEVTVQKCRELVEEIMAHLVPHLQNEMLMSSQRQRYFTRKLQRVVETTALVLVDHTCCGSFRPLKLEVGFGYPGELEPLRLAVRDEASLQLIGRIDRIDQARWGDEVYLRVIDYKSGTVGISLDDIYHGLRLQLLVYLDVVLSNARNLLDGEAVPAGMLYFSIQNPIIRARAPMSREAIEREKRKAFKLKGMVLAEKELVNLMDQDIDGDSQVIPVGIKKDGEFKAGSKVVTREQFARLRCHLHHILAGAGGEILAGEVGIAPYRKKGRRACDYCRFKSVCQFDLMTGNKFRALKDLKNNEVWEKIPEHPGEMGGDGFA